MNADHDLDRIVAARLGYKHSPSFSPSTNYDDSITALNLPVLYHHWHFRNWWEGARLWDLPEESIPMTICTAIIEHVREEPVGALASCPTRVIYQRRNEACK